MRDNFENKLSMFQKVLAFLIKFRTELATIPAIPTLEAELSNEIDDILESATKSGRDLTGFFEQKQSLRSKLKSSLQKVATALFSHYSITNNKEMRNIVDETAAKLDRFRDNDIYLYGNQIRLYGNTEIANLADYGVSPADITTLEADLDNYLAYIPNPRMEAGVRGGELVNLELQVREVDDLIKNKLDPVMTIFQDPNPGLYASYRNVRGIDDTGTPTPPDYEGTIEQGRIEQIVELPYLSSRIYTLRNTGDTELTMGLSEDGINFAGSPVRVEPGMEVSRMSRNLNRDRGDIFLLQNTSPTQTGRYQLRINE